MIRLPETMLEKTFTRIIWLRCLLYYLTDFGDLSKKLADAWKQLPEGDKQVSV